MARTNQPVPAAAKRPAPGERIDLSPWQPLMGKVPDSEIARQAGVARETVRKWRVYGGIRPWRPERRYSADNDKLIASLPTADAAKKLRVSRRAIILRRTWLRRHSQLP